MNSIDELLDKYFAGNSSLQEEKELKIYFGGNNVATEHQKYIPIFQAFINEKRNEMPNEETKIVRRFSLRRRIVSISASVAAAFLLVILVLRFQTTAGNDNYMIVHGKRINNSEMARDFANAKLEKSLNVIHKSLASYKDNEEVQKELQEIENQVKTTE